jgi:voltage-gated potassium channel
MGYVFLEDYSVMDALYMTVITISTVGYAEVKPLDVPGRIFTTFLIIANITTFTYFLAQLSSYFLDGEFIKQYKFHKMKDAINELHNHVIICGFGRNGREAAAILKMSNKDFVVIEKGGGDTTRSDAKYYFHADATRDDVLIEAGIHRASSLIAALPDDADNLFVVLTARDLNPSLQIISRASRDTSVKKLKSAGASNVIMPDKIGGAHMASLVLNPDVNEFIDLLSTQTGEDFSIEEINVGKSITLSDLDAWKKCGATVLGVKKVNAEYIMNPLQDYLLANGEKVIAMGKATQLSGLRELVR